ncbi:SpoIIE family protein phosphatase [Streptomyces sp. 3MP-14]|uniref:SpoIIE family protein phosphatase n=1 Tax=Streptomyces mimosae TaxID=2586635 RepID=A0A5N6A171_9ACTN|nr:MULTISPECIES: SpoIIE family protein phosphatase [Streptomyces]KAB8161962.1 SpoIIE family protein phosphatase [Streptomyces mimosae]KAB8173660.1 SpoIIE family protein phosphatase [Streptomyces sp. 3MP-14]
MCAIPTPGDPGGPSGEPVVLLEVGDVHDGVGGDLGGDCVVLAVTPASEWLTGVPAEELPGTPLADLIPDAEARAAVVDGAVGRWPVTVARREGGRVEAQLDIFPTLIGHPVRRLVALTEAAAARRQEEDRSLVRALFSQQQVGLAIHNEELAVTRMNADPNDWATRNERLGLHHGLPVTLDEIMDPGDARAVGDRLSRVAATGEPLINWEHTYRRVGSPEQEQKLSVTSLRLNNSQGELLGVMSVYTDVTEEHQTRLRLALLHRAAQRIGPSLDVTRNAEELARVLVPDFADLAAVDLGERVLSGDEPGPEALSRDRVRRVATAEAHGRWPDEVQPLGATFRIEMPPDAGSPGGQAIRNQAAAALHTLGADEEPPSTHSTAPLLLPRSPGSLMVVPLRARGQVLGTLALWRSPDRAPFSEADADLAEEVGSRAALSLDNARRYTREHHTLETLQRSLLPPPDFEVTAASTAGHYVPAETTAGIGGSWYDVIPLSSARVAFVIGDVAGHGLNATATMGRLRTAVQTLADMDLAPDELMTRLDDLAIRLAEFASAEEDGQGGAIGATCLYCVYDPVSGECTLASAGRTPPVVAQPGESAEAMPMKPGPALGVGGAPFETFSQRVGPESVMAFFSEELVAEHPQRSASGDAEPGQQDASADRMAELRAQMTRAAASDRSPADAGRAVLDRLLPERAPANDIALLVARVRPLPPDATADWQLPAEPSVVGRARDLVLGKLREWDLAENAFPTELIISELITNAIRYAGGPVGVRLIRDEVLICEVSDPSETQPHLRRARPTDEGGRGLFLVAQLAHRWGSRYTATGKTIWTEQPLG